MSRDLNHLANLNTLDNDGNAPEEQKEEELRMFTNTTFFDLDVGRSTDIATTVDELLIQQERQIQYPHKQQPLDNGPVAGPSYTQSQPPASAQQLREQHREQQHREQQQHEQQQHELSQHDAQMPLPFDFSTLQGFSLAGELPQASLSIYDVDPVIQSQRATATATATPHRTPRPPPIQRHELAEQLARRQEAPQWSEISQRRASQVQDVTPETSPSDHVDAHLNKAMLSEEKRRRNTAASARFRSKKKMREQELERQYKAMQQQIVDQGARIKQLEMENVWLRDLVMEKNTARDSSSLDALRASMLDREATAKASQ